MFSLFGSKAAYKRIAQTLYEALNTQARQEIFYSHYGVKDTTDGRFDMICFHAVLVMGRLQKERKKGRYISQALFDVMFKQMERALREMSVGDLSVPRHVKRMMTAFKGRYYAYMMALDEGDSAGLKDVIARNIYGAETELTDNVLDDMAGYMLAAYRNIMALEIEDFYTARSIFSLDLMKGMKGHDTVIDTRMAA